MLRVAFLGRALILPVLFTSAFAGQLDFEFENLVSNNVQIALNHSDRYQVVCQSISLTISPASQVFYPGAVLALFQTYYLSHMLTFRFSPVRGRHRSLGQLELTDICVLRPARHSKGLSLIVSDTLHRTSS
jgi:hypothetical protein